MVKGGRSDIKLGSSDIVYDTFNRRRPYATGASYDRVKYVPVLINASRRGKTNTGISSMLRLPQGARYSRFNLLNRFGKGRTFEPLFGDDVYTNRFLRRPFGHKRGGSNGVSMLNDRAQLLRDRRVLGQGGGFVGRRRLLGQGGAADTSSSPSRNRRGGKPGAFRKRGGAISTEKLDEDLDRYMGEDVRKSRLDTQLDAYFATAENQQKSDAEAGEIIQ